MTEKPKTFFPYLEGDERRRAEEWLYAYLKLVIRIYNERTPAQNTELSTPRPLTDGAVLARSVRPTNQASLTQSDE